MKNASTLWGEDSKATLVMELPAPVNPFDTYHNLRQQDNRKTRKKVYKRLGDRTYRLFMTNQALHEVAQLYINQSGRRRVLQ